MRLENIFLGPEVEEVLQSVPVFTDSEGRMSREQLVLQRENEIKTFRFRCLDFYVTAAKEIKSRLPINKPMYKEMRFISPTVALSGDARMELQNLPLLCRNFKVSQNFYIKT